jgi:hypothetical protein
MRASVFKVHVEALKGLSEPIRRGCDGNGGRRLFRLPFLSGWEQRLEGSNWPFLDYARLPFLRLL